MDLDKLNTMFNNDIIFRDINDKKIQLYDILSFLPKNKEKMKLGIVKQINKNVLRLYSLDKTDYTNYNISNEKTKSYTLIVNEMYNKDILESFRKLINEKDTLIKKQREDNTETYILFAYENKIRNTFGFYIMFHQGKFNKQCFLEKIKTLQNNYKDFNFYPFLKKENDFSIINNINKIKYGNIKKYSSFHDIGLCDSLINCFIEIHKENNELIYKYSDDNSRDIPYYSHLSLYYLDRNKCFYLTDGIYNYKLCIFNDLTYSRKYMPLDKKNHLKIFDRFINK